MDDIEHIHLQNKCKSEEKNKKKNKEKTINEMKKLGKPYIFLGFKMV